MNASNIKEVLIAAKWILENYGWCQNSFITSNKDGVPRNYSRLKYVAADGADTNTACFCADGAIRSVECSLTLQEQAREHLEKYIKANVWGWNDGADRTKEEVLAAFDGAIATA